MALSELRHAYNNSFEIVAVHVSTDLGVNAPVPQLRHMLAAWNIDLVEIHVGVRERLKPGRAMNCYWCSTQRRTDLIAWAMANGYNKMALGHHLDDILETMFMNMMQKGELSTMPVKLRYNKYPLTIIRPLALIEERQIIDWIQKANLASATCTCPFGVNSHRRDIRQRIATLTEGFPGAKLRLFRSLGNMKPTYLPGFACTEGDLADDGQVNSRY